VKRLAERRHAAVFPDVSFAGVVGRDREIGVALECIQQPAEVADATIDVGFGVEGIDHSETLRGSRHELHQPSGAFVRDFARIEIRFGLDDR